MPAKPNAAFARAQIADLLASYPNRGTALVATIAALVATWSLPAIDPAAFPLFDCATARGAGDIGTTNGSASITSTAAAWSSADIGKDIYVPAAGDSGAALAAQIIAVAGPGSATISTTAGATGAFLGVWGRPVPSSYTVPTTRGEEAEAGLLSSAVDPRQFGAKGDGVTDDSAAMGKAMATGRPVRIPAGCSFVCSGVIMDKRCPALIGDGPSSVIKSTGDTVAITINATGCRVEGVTFVGSGKASGFASQAGLSLLGPTVNVLRSVVINCTFSGFPGRGLYAAYTNASGHMEGNQVIGCHFLDCVYGYLSQAVGEYMGFSACTFWGCTYGAQIAGGNNTFTNCKFSNNVDGLNLVNGANDSHGFAVGCQFNHNTYPIDINATQYGFVFDGCTFFQGTLNLVSCSGITIKNGFLDVDAYYFFIATGIVIEGNVMLGGYANTPNNDANYRASRIQWRNNRALAGTHFPIDWAGQIEGGYVRATQNAAQNIGNGANAAIAPQVFDNFVSWIASYSGDTFFNIATGEFTAKGYGRGDVEVDLQVKITGAGTLATSYLAIQVDGVTKGYCPLTTFNGITMYRWNGRVKINAGQKLRFLLANNSGNTITIPNDTDTFIQVEGL